MSKKKSFCSLKGKRIIVTGASSGLGRATAVKISQLDAVVCLIGREVSRLQETLTSMKENDHLIIPTDLTVFEEYDNIFNIISSKLGKLDGLVHFAGIRKTLPLKTMKAEALREMLEINLVAFLELVKFFTKKKFVNEQGGSIIGISSVMSLRGAPALSGYGCSKAALDGAVRSLACEFAPRKIRINSIAPGFVKTSMNEDVLKTLPQEAIDQIINNHPLGIGTPDDVANLVAFLQSDESTWITGTTIKIDGGFSIRS